MMNVLQQPNLIVVAIIAICCIVYEEDSDNDFATNVCIGMIMIVVGVVYAYLKCVKKKRRTKRLIADKETQLHQNQIQLDEDQLIDSLQNDSNINPSQNQLTDSLQSNSEEDVEPKLSQPVDVLSLVNHNTYEIISIKNIDADICCLYPYLKHDYTTIQSVLNSNIIYFFNTTDSYTTLPINYKYDINTKTWHTICNLDEENKLVYPECFYLNVTQGLIGVLEQGQSKVRIYDEINDEWSMVEMDIMDKVPGSENHKNKGLEIKKCTSALDPKNMIYHFVDSDGQHFTYNLNTFELHRISVKIPFNFRKKEGKLIYNEYNHSLIYVYDFWMNLICEYDIKKRQWETFSCSFNNFQPENWRTTYREFGCLCLNKTNKIITFGGNFDDEVLSKYIFELDLTTKYWSLLNPNLYAFSEAFNVGTCFVEAFKNNDECYRVHVLDTDWEECGLCNHVIIEIKCNKIDAEITDINLYAAPNSISIKLSRYDESGNVVEEKYNENDTEFDDIENNYKTNNSIPIIPLSTDFRSKGIEIVPDNTYNIESIEISDEISRHHVSGCCIVQSVFDPNILYFFNANHKDYKYNMNTNKWKRIKEMDKEYQVTCCREKNAFYLDINKGLIGITGDWDMTNIVRIYDELKQEWNYEPFIKQKLNLKPCSTAKDFEIKPAAVALDTKNKIYHVVMYSKHVTYNLNTKEWKEMGHSPHHISMNSPCFIYNKHNETLYYVSQFNEMHCYKIKENEWITEPLKCHNFVPFSKYYNYFGFIHLNNLNKILTFGGQILEKKIDYIFELDLNEKVWKLLDTNIHTLPVKMHIQHCIAQDIGNGMYKINIFNRKWNARNHGKECRLTMYIKQSKMDSFENNKKYYAKMFVMPKRIKEIKRKAKKNKNEKENICIHQLETKSGVVVCGYIHKYFSNDILDENILKTISLYFCFAFTDFNGIWEIKKDENSKQFLNNNNIIAIEDMTFLQRQFIGDVHSIEHDLYNDTLKIHNYYYMTTTHCGVTKLKQNIDSNYDCKQYHSRTKWSKNRKESITILNNKQTNIQYTIQRYINNNKYFLTINNGQNEILREYYKIDEIPKNA
eukprot:370183_1